MSEPVYSHVFFHATDESFESFAMEFASHFGLHFGTLKQAQSIALRLDGDQVRIITARISPKQALRMEDLGIWKFELVARECKKLGVLSADEYEAAWNANDSEDALRGLLVGKGFDAIVYRNEVEGVGDSLLVLDEKIIEIVSHGERQYRGEAPGQAGG